MTDAMKSDAEIANSYGYTAEAAPLFSLLKRRGDKIAKTLDETKQDGSVTWHVTIEKQDEAEAVFTFLEANGAAVLESVVKLDAYLNEFEMRLKAGLLPTEARDNALAIVNETARNAEFERHDAEIRQTIAARIANGDYS